MNTGPGIFLTKPYLRLLDLYVNMFLFGHIIYPDFLPRRKLLLNNKLTNVLKDIKSLDSEETKVVMQNFINQFNIDFKEELNDYELFLLMDCYKNSIFRMNFQKNILQNSKNAKHEAAYYLERDDQIINDLLWSLDVFPEEILNYLYNHFQDIIITINVKSKKISEKEYFRILQKYRQDL